MQKNYYCLTANFGFILFLLSNPLAAQDYVFKDTLLSINFGSIAHPQNFNLRGLTTYNYYDGACPNDGNVSFNASSPDCYSGHWFSLPEDHTAGDVSGRMMFINAAPTPAVFFTAGLAGFKPNTAYEFSVWIMNICKLDYECTGTLPDILITLQSPDKTVVAKLRTGDIQQSTIPQWRRLAGVFTTTSNVSVITLSMADLNPGGCGNDFVIDDIAVRECYKPDPIIIDQTPPPPVIKRPLLLLTKPAIGAKPKEQNKLKKNTAPVAAIPGKAVLAGLPAIKKVVAPVPDVLKKRENALAKKLIMPEGEILISLYDNGIVDGDTVSVYDNNKLVAYRAGISEKAVQVKILISKTEPHHELTMVAENLGSIPPNTSLMIVTAEGRREEIFISSNEQKNARVIIDLQ